FFLFLPTLRQPASTLFPYTTLFRSFLWSSIGIMVGALSAGPIGDRLGRKPLLLASLLIFGLASLFSAFAGSLFTLSVLRFFTGRSEEHTSELQSRGHLVCRLLLEKK